MLEDLERYRAGTTAQLAALREALAGGMPRRGWKVGINVPEVLASLGLRHPGVGWLDGHRSYASGDVVPATSGARLHVEPELALRVRSRISPAMSAREALSQVAGVAPALELVDYAKPGETLDAVVAHSMFHAGLVVGAWQPAELTSQLGRRWPVLSAAGRETPPPRSDLVPQDLGALLLFVASFLDAFGQALEPEDLVLSGSYHAKAARLAPGTRATADFGPLGSVEVSVAG
jgi:2-keto-4-pentenoate hydratase